MSPVRRDRLSPQSPSCQTDQDLNKGCCHGHQGLEEDEMKCQELEAILRGRSILLKIQSAIYSTVFSLIPCNQLLSHCYKYMKTMQNTKTITYIFYSVILLYLDNLNI